MVSSAMIANDLAAIFVPIGMIGAGIALLCALVAAIALAVDSAGVTGGAIGGWLVGALLSMAAAFAQEWMPVAASGVALVGALVLGGVARVVVKAVARRAPASAEAAVPLLSRMRALRPARRPA